jgi:hypothetical protein
MVMVEAKRPRKEHPTLVGSSVKVESCYVI